MFSLQKDNIPFWIAEVGQNHQGDINHAIKFINEFSKLGANAIKFQTRNNQVLFSEDSYSQIYNSENSFGITYGEHREKLELDKSCLIDLKKECKKNDVFFMSTPFDEPSLDLLLEVGVDILKIASFDIGNLPFIDLIAKSKIPLVMSVGGANSLQIKSSVEQVNKYHNDLAVLHCVSEYPCPAEKLRLGEIEIIQKHFENVTVGLSDHFNGTLSGPIAYTKGARVFEKHVTFDRSQKGTDHSFSLEPEGFKKFVRDIKRVPAMIDNTNADTLGKELVFKKLGKSIIARSNLEKGTKIKIHHLSGAIFKSEYIPVRQSNEIIGKKTRKTIKKGDPIVFEDIE